MDLFLTMASLIYLDLFFLYLNKGNKDHSMPNHLQNAIMHVLVDIYKENKNRTVILTQNCRFHPIFPFL
jgi:hypothetical protein